MWAMKNMEKDIRQLTQDLFIGVPTTTAKNEDSKYFHNVSYKDNHDKIVNSSCMILQIKTLSKKRITNKIGTISKDDFESIKKKIRDLFPPNK